MPSGFDRRLAVAIPATMLATASLGMFLYSSGRLRFKSRFPYVFCSLKRSFAKVEPRTAPRLGAPSGGISVDPKTYPWVHRDPEVVEKKFGFEVADPYRGLEDPDSSQTAAFVESQNFFAAQILEKCKTRDEFKALFTRMYDTPKHGCPHEESGRYFFRYNTGLQNQSTLYIDDGRFQNSDLFLDPNQWSQDGTVAMTGTYFSEDGSLMAYTVSSGGSDWQKIKLLSVKPKPVNGQFYEEMEDQLEFVKFSSVAWTHDGSGFFYSRFPEPDGTTNGNLGRENTSNKYHHVCYHVVGTPQSADVVVMRLDNKPDNMLEPEVSEDGQYLIITEDEGCSPGNAVHYLDLSRIPRNDVGVMDFRNCSSQITTLVKDIKDSYSFISNEGTLFTFRTNAGAPRQKLVLVDLKTPREWRDLLPQHEKDVLQWACAIRGDKMILCYLKDCSNILELRTLSSGELISELGIPKFGSVTSFSGKKSSSEVFFAHQSVVFPPTIYRFHAEENLMTIVHRTEISGYDPEQYTTEQVFVESLDKKVKIPMFVTHKKGTEMNGQNPTILSGYGGFGVSLMPTFSVSSVAFVLGYNGIVAQANLRGGNEYGLEWRRGGNLENKQNVFDDFQSCAAYLIDRQYCSPGRLAIRGGSNGGLLVAACANQRPDLFGCVVCSVGVLDMLRFHQFTIGHAWMPEYGNPDTLDAFEYLIKYSPLHNIQIPSGGTQQYPSMLMTTGDHDDRVSPLHTFKFLAELQHVFCAKADSRQTNPLIARIETKAGHGAGKPTAFIIDEVTDVMAFVASVLEAEWQL